MAREIPTGPAYEPDVARGAGFVLGLAVPLFLFLGFALWQDTERVCYCIFLALLFEWGYRFTARWS